MKNCNSCKYMYTEFDEYNNIYAYCKYFNCQIKEIVGLNANKGCTYHIDGIERELKRIRRITLANLIK